MVLRNHRNQDYNYIVLGFKDIFFEKNIKLLLFLMNVTIIVKKKDLKFFINSL